jgi:hypothetical protein
VATVINIGEPAKERIVVYSALVSLIIIACENADRLGRLAIMFAVGMYPPLTIVLLVLALLWTVLLLQERLKWVPAILARRGGLVAIVFDAFGALAVAGRMPEIMNYPPIRVGRTPGLILLMCTPIIYIAGERWRGRTCARDQAAL